MAIRLLVRAATLLAVLLGVLAMHGVAQHGSQVVAASTTTAAAGASPSHADHPQGASGAHSEHPAGHSGALALCLAALGILLASAARRVARGWPASTGATAGRVALLPALLASARPVRPPGPHTLMVMRC